MENDYEFTDLRHIEIGNGCSTTGLVGGALIPPPRRKNKYHYDKDHRVKEQLNRTVAYIRGPFTPANARTNTIYNTEYDYDDAGNITTLQRNGLVLLSEVEGWANPTGNFGDLEANQHFGQIDDLTYIYQGGTSRLGQIDEAASGPGRPLGVPQSTKILYDLLGNITAIPGKELEVTAYNELNLPGTMKVKDKTIKHTYDGSGMTLRQAQEPLKTEVVGGKATTYGVAPP